MTDFFRKTNENSVDKGERKLTFYLLTGAIAGLVNGLFGGGGGMIVVPMLTKVLKYEEQIAHATAILIILPLSIVSGLFYASFGVVDLSLLISTGIGVVLGGAFGAFILSKINSKWLAGIFYVVMIIAGVKTFL